tara:strand:- start:282 stop:470 length:189 start_codon:yes stop_codon:yes gene_type:complete
MYEVTDLVDMDIHKEIIHKEEKKLSYLEWREEMERQYDVMPRRYFREAQSMYEEYLNNEAHD